METNLSVNIDVHEYQSDERYDAMNDEVHVNEVDFDVDWIQTQGRWFNFSFCHNFQALVINIL